MLGDVADLSAEERRQLRNGVVRLTGSRRFGSEIGALAEAVRAGDADTVVGLLHEGGAVALTADDGAVAGRAGRRGRAARAGRGRR